MSEASQERVLGRLEAKVDILLEEQEKATRARKDQYEKLEQITRKADEAERKFAGLLQRIEEVEKPVAELKVWKERGVGALMLISFVSAIVGVLATIAWRKILALFS